MSGGRGGIGEAQGARAAARVEVEPRGDRDPGLGEDAGREGAAVARSGHLGDVGVDVEGAVRRRDAGEAGPRQAFEHQRAVGAVDGEVGVELRRRVEGGERRDLAGVRRADEEVLHQPLDAADVRFGHHHPADAPAGHREVLREGVDDVDLVGDLEGRDGAAAVLDAVVDLVGDEGEVELGGALDERAELGARRAWCRSGWPGSPPARRRGPASGRAAWAGSGPRGRWRCRRARGRARAGCCGSTDSRARRSRPSRRARRAR